jgi:membrane-associated protein
VGRWAGRSAYGWKDRSLGFFPLYRRSWLKETEDFFKRWGSFAVIAGRWVPFVRTGAPLLAGVTRLGYASFIPYNIIGALSWVWSMVLVGYFLPPVVARLWPGFVLEDHIDAIILVVVAVSCLPIVYTYLSDRKGRAATGGKAAPAKHVKRAAKKRR